MSKKKKDNVLKVLIACPSSSLEVDGIIPQMEKILKEKFKCRFDTVTDVGKLGAVFYYLMPHFIIMDPGLKKLIERLDEKYDYLKQLREKPVLMIRNPDFSEQELARLSIRDITFIPYSAPEDEIEKKICLMAEKVGFIADSGKVLNRLVKRSIEVILEVDGYDEKLTGMTTGLNEKGLGARVRASVNSHHELETLAGRSCRVDFSKSGLWFMPVDGKIIRVEESRDSNYNAYVAVVFGGGKLYFDDDELKALDNFIKSQKDESIMKNKPADG